MPTDAPTREIGTSSPSGGAVLPWSAFIDTAEYVPELAWPRAGDTLERMWADGQINGLLLAYTLPIRRYRWFIDPQGARAEVVEDIAEQMGLPIKGQEPKPPRRLRRRFSHDDHLRHALMSLLYGHMFFEQVGDVLDPSTGFPDGRWFLRKLAPRLPKTLSEIKVAQDGGLVSITQNVGNGLSVPEPIPVSALVAYVHDKLGGNWYGRSMFRACYRPWLIKDRLLRVDSLKHERNGMGIPVAEAPQGATQPQIDALDAMAQAWKAGEASGGALPYGARMRLVGTEGALPDTLASIRYQDQDMAMAVNAMFATLGQTPNGSRALGDTYLDVFAMAQGAIADWYKNITTAHVIEDIVDWNYGEDEPAPALGYSTDGDPTEMSLEDLAKMMTAGAIVVDPALEAYLRERYHLPEKDEDAEPAAPPPPPQPVDNPVEGPGANETTASYRARRRTARAMARGWQGIHATARAARPQRAAHAAMTLPEGRNLRRQPYSHEIEAAADYDGMEALYVEHTDALVLAWVEVQAEQLDDLLDQIVAALGEGGDVAALATIQAEAIGADLLLEAMATMAEESAEIAVAEAAAQGATLAMPTAEALREAIAPRAVAIDNLMTNALSQTVANKAVSLAGPDTAAETITAAVREHVENLSGQYVKDQMSGATVAAQNTGRKAAMADAPANIYASELLDDNTCGPCRAVDGREYATVDEAEEDYPTGGHAKCDGGPRCRGTLVAVYSEAEAS